MNHFISIRYKETDNNLLLVLRFIYFDVTFINLNILSVYFNNEFES